MARASLRGRRDRSVPKLTVRPSRAWYLLVPALLVAAYAVQLVAAIPLMRAHKTCFDPPGMLIRGPTEVTFDSAGQWQLWNLQNWPVDGSVRAGSHDIAGLAFRLERIADGSNVPLRRPKIELSRSGPTKAGRRLYVCRVPEPGRYRLIPEHPDGAGIPELVVGFSPDAQWLMARTAPWVLSAWAVAIVAAIAVPAVVWTRRRRNLARQLFEAAARSQPPEPH